MIAIKLIAMPVTVTAGLLGSASPLIHIGVTKSNYKTKWYERTDFTQPIFKNCKYNGKNPLNVYLTLAGGEVNVPPDSKKVSLKVVEKSNSGERIVWGVGSDNSHEEVWKQLKLQYSGDQEKKIKFMYPYQDQWDRATRTGIATCDDMQVEFVADKGGFRDSDFLEFKDIQVTVSEGSKCIEGFNKVECEVEIGPDNQIQWKEGFKPKIIYTAF
ncbi:hypothetical protein WEN_02140 [Mycoplasma wenyonii str. Massachusetts]|uniref:Uncharacterized protein n=1 Tax=Mycoplasma wenyonii (strain Massachusetts) TaxID=1197325 RepID=I6ZF25_MYCWM|nr:hypothetical protein [Mycoplasma wenyonii]AFN65217.1 hypothetical protein WEN_02140 [Mycoplasma wenyonii str. Massachusetts]